MAMWNRCAICGRAIPVGELCYGIKNWCGDPVGGDTICRDCLVPENAPTLTPPNEPLTLEQLREMDGKPVYLVDLDFPHLSGWHIASWNDCFAATTVHSSRGDYYDSRREYGATWICYRRQPEGEEDI